MEDYRGEKKVGVYPTTPGRDARERGRPNWRGLKDSRSQDPSARKLLPEMRRGNSPPKRLEGSNQKSTAEVLQ